jgi:uncharacterized protein YgbK (DUF1537 family)
LRGGRAGRAPAAVRARLERHAAAFACDAETDGDLAIVAAAAAGLPAVLAGSAGLARALAARVPVRPAVGHPLRRPLLVVAGSGHPVTREQVARLEARGGRVLVAAPAVAGGDPGGLVRDLAEAARREIEHASPRTLLLTGGETAYRVCRALAAEGIALGGEAAPGVAAGVLLGGPWEGLTVLTKAGGFGDADTLVQIWESCR